MAEELILTVKCSKYPVDGEYDWSISAGVDIIAECFGRVGHGPEGIRDARATAILMSQSFNLIAVLIRAREELRLIGQHHKARTDTALDADMDAVINRAEGKS